MLLLSYQFELGISQQCMYLYQHRGGSKLLINIRFLFKITSTLKLLYVYLQRMMILKTISLQVSILSDQYLPFTFFKSEPIWKHTCKEMKSDTWYSQCNDKSTITIISPTLQSMIEKVVFQNLNLVFLKWSLVGIIM